MRIPNILLQDKCSIKRYKGASALGPIFEESTPYEAKCRFEAKRKEAINESGEEFFTKGMFYLLPTEKNKSIKARSIITFDSEEFFVEAVENHKGFVDSHVVVLI